nr:cilia- and flagella-associated protein 100-like [Halyomorpha halys]
MDDPGDPIILCSEEKRENMLRLRRKVATAECKSGRKYQLEQRSTIKRISSPAKPAATSLPDIEEADTELPNPYKNQSREQTATTSRGYSAPTHRWGLVSGLRRRNRVADVTQERKRPSMDEEFLKIIQGRPIKTTLVRRQYIKEVRERLLNNVLSGFLQDEIKAKEENVIAVNAAVEQTEKEIENTSKSLADFLSEKQKKCENLTKELNLVVKERKRREAMIENEKKRMNEVKLNIFKQNEQLETMRKCRDFVFQIAPKEWKEEYAKETEKRQAAVKEESEKMRTALENFKNHCGGEDPGLEKVLEDFVEEFSKAGPPLLPFSEPKMVLSLFKDLEMKSLRTLQNNAILKEKVENAKKICDYYETYLKKEQVTIHERLKDIKENIEKEERKVKKKERLLQKMLDGPFKKMVASEEILKEFALVKDVYQEVIDEPKEGLGTLEMLQEIGELYVDLNRKLEHLPESTRKSLRRKVKIELQRKMKDAENSERRKNQVLQMMKGIQRSREKPWKTTGRKLLYRSPLEIDDPVTILQAKSPLKDQQKDEESDGEAEELLPLVWASNHPGPGPYKREMSVVLPDPSNFLPDLQLIDTEESEALLSESEEEQDKKGAKSQPTEKKKIKKKKRVKIILSDSD